MKGVTSRQDRAWLIQFILAPQAAIDRGDPYALKLQQEARGVVMANVAGLTPDLASRLLDLIDTESALPKSQFAGVQISELLPHAAKIMHRLTVVRSVNSNVADHFQGHYALQSGRLAPGYPVLGSAVAKLLERPGDVLPGYVSIRRDGPKAYTDVGDAGFLGAKYEGVRIVNNQPPENLLQPPAVKPALAEAVEHRAASGGDRGA